MRFVYGSAFVVFTVGMLMAPDVSAQEANRAVADGGISVPGWTGKIDAKAESQGRNARQRKARSGR